MIQYPIARVQDGSPVHIDAWDRGQAVTCFGCGQELIGRLPHNGTQPTAHFAHKAEAACGGETALHRAAKAAIVRAHAAGILRHLSSRCALCRRIVPRVDLRALVLREEARPCEGVVSDVLGSDEFGAPRVAIEVVVTHDLEKATLDRYRSHGITVFSFRASWESVGDLMRGVEALLVDPRVGEVSPCEGCQTAQTQLARRQLEDARWKAWVKQWTDIGAEAYMQASAQRRLWEAQRKRIERWWAVWLEVWPQIATKIVEDWWSAWLSLWRAIGRIESWWVTWSRVWQRIAMQIIKGWWDEWLKVWQAIGYHYSAPYRWKRAWCAVWRLIGEQHAARLDAERRRSATQRLHSEEIDRQRHRNWWRRWLRLWRAVGRCAAGMRICPACWQDLTPGSRHQCSW